MFCLFLLKGALEFPSHSLFLNREGESVWIELIERRKVTEPQLTVLHFWFSDSILWSLFGGWENLEFRDLRDWDVVLISKGLNLTMDLALYEHKKYASTVINFKLPTSFQLINGNYITKGLFRLITLEYSIGYHEILVVLKYNIIYLLGSHWSLTLVLVLY